MQSSPEPGFYVVLKDGVEIARHQSVERLNEKFPDWNDDESIRIIYKPSEAEKQILRELRLFRSGGNVLAEHVDPFILHRQLLEKHGDKWIKEYEGKWLAVDAETEEVIDHDWILVDLADRVREHNKDNGKLILLLGISDDEILI